MHMEGLHADEPLVHSALEPHKLVAQGGFVGGQHPALHGQKGFLFADGADNGGHVGIEVP